MSFRRHGLVDLHGRHLCCAAKYLVYMALMIGGQVHHHDKSHSALFGEVLEKTQKRMYAARRCAYTDDRKRQARPGSVMLILFGHSKELLIHGKRSRRYSSGQLG